MTRSVPIYPSTTCDTFALMGNTRWLNHITIYNINIIMCLYRHQMYNSSKQTELLLANSQQPIAIYLALAS